MKLQIDLDAKIIRIEENVNLGEFFSKLEELLPDLKWREYELKVSPNTPTYPYYNPINYYGTWSVT